MSSVPWTKNQPSLAFLSLISCRSRTPQENVFQTVKHPSAPLLPKAPEVLCAGQEGLEPPTNGFGDRRSTNWSYWPVSELPRLPVESVALAPLAVLLELKTVRIILLILLGRVIATLALGACESDQSTHLSSLR